MCWGLCTQTERGATSFLGGCKITWTCFSAILRIIDFKFQTHRPSQMTVSPCLTCYCLEWDLMGIHVPSSQSILFWRWELYVYQTYRQRNDFLLSLLPFSSPFMPFKRKDEHRKMQLWLFQSSCYIKDVISLVEKHVSEFTKNQRFLIFCTMMNLYNMYNGILIFKHACV